MSHDGISPVPGGGSDQHPAFVTAEACREWLAQTPLTHPVQALAHLLRQLHLLNRQRVDAGERLAILEVLRKPLFLVHAVSWASRCRWRRPNRLLSRKPRPCGRRC
jgi:hypothetical protein